MSRGQVVPLTEIPEEQVFGDQPTAVRSTDHYQAEYVADFVSKWDALIDWEARTEREGQFFVRQLEEMGKHKILDVATGTGFHSVQLLKAGFNVTSVDGNAQMLVKAIENAKQHGHVLQPIHADWRWLNRDVDGTYDAVICLGNSFTHLFEENDRRRALVEFYAVLKHDGVMILDQRNFDAILDEGFSSQEKYYFSAQKVSAKPVHVDSGLARFEYIFPDGSTHYLNMFPLRKEYVRQLIREAGFQRVKTFGDFQAAYREDEPDFFVHIAAKAYRG